MINGHRDYKREYNEYHSRPEQIKHREERNKARAAIKRRLGHNPKGDVDHIKPLAKGGSNRPSNWRVISVHDNRSYPRTKGGHIK